MEAGQSQIAQNWSVLERELEMLKDVVTRQNTIIQQVPCILLADIFLHTCIRILMYIFYVNKDY